MRTYDVHLHGFCRLCRPCCSTRPASHSRTACRSLGRPYSGLGYVELYSAGYSTRPADHSRRVYRNLDNWLCFHRLSGSSGYNTHPADHSKTACHSLLHRVAEIAEDACIACCKIHQAGRSSSDLCNRAVRRLLSPWSFCCRSLPYVLLALAHTHRLQRGARPCAAISHGP
jgi:hypothetical protein